MMSARLGSALSVESHGGRRIAMQTRRVSALGRGVAAVAMLALVAGAAVPRSFAQQPAPPAPKGQPKGKEQPKGQPKSEPAPAPGGEPQLTYSAWTKVCQKGPDANAKGVCFIGRDGRIESGMPLVAAV